MTKRYTLDQKVRALDLLAQGESTINEVATNLKIPIATVRAWKRDEAAILAAHTARLQRDSARQMHAIQSLLADKSMTLLSAMTADKIEKAPLNQISSALGVLIDRFLKLHGADFDDLHENTEQEFRFVYQYPDGSIHDVAPWAEDDSQPSGAVQGGGVRQTLRQDGVGENAADRTGDETGSNGMVARPDLFDGGASLARFESDD